MRYLRDLPLLRAQFARIDPQKYSEIINADEKPADPMAAAAWAAFTREYVQDGPELTTLTVRDLNAVSARGPLPRWALSLLTPADFKHMKAVKEHDKRQR